MAKTKKENKAVRVELYFGDEKKESYQRYMGKVSPRIFNLTYDFIDLALTRYDVWTDDEDKKSHKKALNDIEKILANYFKEDKLEEQKEVEAEAVTPLKKK